MRAHGCFYTNQNEMKEVIKINNIPVKATLYIHQIEAYRFVLKKFGLNKYGRENDVCNLP